MPTLLPPNDSAPPDDSAENSSAPLHRASSSGVIPANFSPTPNPALAAALSDDATLRRLIAFVDARHDCADFRVACLLGAWFRGRDHLSSALAAEVKRCLLGFAYWLDEPGVDTMCLWSENHQVLVAACEYLAGQAFPEGVFTNSFLRGADHQAKAEVRLRRWLAHRFAYGFSEWLSNTYYEQDVAALVLLVDHADNPDLAQRAAIVLDLALLDMAMHRFDGHFVATAGRAYEQQKKHPEQADVNTILAHAFGPPADHLPAYELDRLSSLFVHSTRYRVPDALRQIAADTGTHRIMASYGLDVGEVARLVDDPHDIETAGMTYWAMEAFTTPQSIDVTVRTLREYRLQNNRFLAPLAPFAALRRTRALPLLVRALNPATQGVALQRANVQTYRTPHFLLSSTQQYHPGEFGDQQHLWQASLPGGVNIFATHPGAPIFDSDVRALTPSAWVGNGINPDIGQDGDLLLALYDTRGRRGYLERGRQSLSHLSFPAALFDDTVLERTLVAGRVGNSYLGIVTVEALEQAGDDELIQPGQVTGYVVVLGSAEEAPWDAFLARVRRHSVRYDHDTLTCWTPEARYDLHHRGAFRKDGRPLPLTYPRFDTPWVRAERPSSRIDITGTRHRLTLDWADGVRHEQPC